MFRITISFISEDGDKGNPAGGGNNTATSSVQPPLSYDASTGNQQSSSNVEGGNIAEQ